MTINDPVTSHPTVDVAEDRFRQFRTEVRDLAIRGYRDGDWSLNELNDSLRRLELEPHTPRRFTRSHVLIKFTLTRDGDNIHDAENRLRQLAHHDSATDTVRQALTELTDRHFDATFTLEPHDIRVVPDYTHVVED